MSICAAPGLSTEGGAVAAWGADLLSASGSVLNAPVVAGSAHC